MLTFVVRRLLLAVPVLLGVVFVVMLTIDLLPGDAVTLMLGEHATKDAVAALTREIMTIQAEGDYDKAKALIDARRHQPAGRARFVRHFDRGRHDRGDALGQPARS